MRALGIGVIAIAACAARSELDVAAIVGASPDSPCDRSHAFGTPTLVSGVDTSIDQNGGTPSADGLTLFFEQGSTFEGFDLFTATRAALDEPFNNVTPLSSLNTPRADGDPFLAPDQKTLFWVRETNVLQIFQATRASATGAFGPASAVPNVSSNAGEGTPSITADNALLCFASSRSGGLGQRDVWCAKRGSDGQFAQPTNATELDSPSDESGVALSPDGLVIYVGSNRAGTHGDRDIWRAERASRDIPFGPLVNLEAVNTSSWEQPVWISGDDCTLYLDSTRPGGAGGGDIYVARRMP